jgi:hypothetical protein
MEITLDGQFKEHLNLGLKRKEEEEEEEEEEKEKEQLRRGHVLQKMSMPLS